MFPASQGLNLDIQAISGICGSISIACWIVVFSPQIIENFKRSSADGLSLQFIIVWLAGDVFNILGAILQGVLPTMLILAVYYTLADIVLLGQCFYYRGFTWRDEVVPPTKSDVSSQARIDHVTEHSSLLPTTHDGRHHSIDATHLSPVTPLIATPTNPQLSPKKPSLLKSVLLNTSAVLMVCLAGFIGWYLSTSSQAGTHTHKHHHHHHEQHDPNTVHPDPTLSLNLWGQIFGYFCAALYLSSRLPQLLLNYRRKSTEGISMLFFLFACIGNLTYVLSIFAYEPSCVKQRNPGCEAGEAREVYARYILVNTSWLVGSLGTLFLDGAIFAQFWLYRVRDEADGEERDEIRRGVVVNDDRPLLQRGDSDFAGH